MVARIAFSSAAGVVGERGQDADLAVEVDDFGVVLARAAGCVEADRRFLRHPHPLIHARAGVEQQREGDRLLGVREEGHVLLGAVFEDLKSLLGEIGGVIARCRR